jgi:hypothetical protein
MYSLHLKEDKGKASGVSFQTGCTILRFQVEVCYYLQSDTINADTEDVFVRLRSAQHRSVHSAAFDLRHM